MKREYSIKKFFIKHILIILFFVISVLLLIQYYFSHKMVLELTQKRFYHLAKQTSVVIEERDKQAKDVVAILGSIPDIRTIESDNKEKKLLKIFITPMKQNNTIYAIYIGYPNGSYFEVINVKHSKAVRKMFNAPENARWIVEQIIRVKGVGYRLAKFYDENLKYISKIEGHTQYDPRKRPWYRKAINKKEVVSTAPYLYYRLKKMGITYSLSLDDKMVIALDITLEGLNTFLKGLKSNSNIEIFMVEKDKMIASSENTNMNELERDIIQTLKKKPQNIISYLKNGEEYLSMAIPAKTENNYEIWLVFRAKKLDMMKPYINIIYSEIIITLLLLLIVIPLVKHLSNRFLRPINSLLQENKKIKNRDFDNVREINSEILELNQLSNSLVDMAKSIKEYEKKQEVLLEGLIHLMANTIDTKSHYTGEHCKRVPILVKMLITKVDASQEGNLKNFKIKNKEMLKGIEWSAWLHDCGKLVVPDHIIDKATKLETIYNRIHEIRTRFEVLLRDAQIEYLKAIINGESEDVAENRFNRKREKLQSDFEFIANLNLGGEFLLDEDLERLKEISQIKWTRHFSKILGVSKEELALLKETKSLPVEENLIQDGVEFQMKRPQKDFDLFNREQVKMQIPPLLYNKGELYNLSIKRGTLTREERFKIQEHAIHTLRILKELPWTKNLKQVVEDAANHHEHLDGTGYPRALGEKELSIPARVMAIADIFEALTSSDRPYKKYKTLSEALEIMAKMSKERKIDFEIFKLFIREKVYLEFAKLHLKPEQIDPENIDEERLFQEARG